ncbi:UNVERIFIED_CONTAM: hypothetical protein Slati_3830900 [Sesamum latifolium]|uniref:MULE transposase domain-containing protein n=1 Tax=Sesamum latifolium TaxID=2727402 RepID=A0AAW2TK36_9LAMI
MGAKQWFSDCEEEELRSVRGSDDEGERCPEWNDRMDMGEVDLAVGMKFETKKNCRDVIRDWAANNWVGWVFFEGLYKGQLLAAIGRDPNENIYPITFAFVEVEKFDSWLWFLRLLLRDIGSQEERGWTFISDRQKGLIDAVTELAPGAKHRFCLRHMYNNFKGTTPGTRTAPSPTRTAPGPRTHQVQAVQHQVQQEQPQLQKQGAPKATRKPFKATTCPVASKASHLNLGLEQVGPTSISTQEHFAKECPSQPPLPKAARKQQRPVSTSSKLAKRNK